MKTTRIGTTSTFFRVARFGSARFEWLGLGLVLLLVAGCPSTTTTVVTDGPDDPVRDTRRTTSATDDFAEATALWERPEPRDFEEMEDLLESAVEKDPQLAVAWFNLGVVREKLGDRDEAISAYRQSNAADPTFADGLANIGAILLEQGRTTEATQILEQVVEIDQFHPGANLNLARIHRSASQGEWDVRQEEADQAINRIRLSLAGDAMNVAAYETLAAVYSDLTRYQLARLVCVNAMDLGLESAELRNRLGLILLAQDDVTGAYAQFRQAVALDDSLVEASMNLGAVALNYRDYAGALDAFNTVLVHDPENIDAMNSRSVALRGQEDLEGAAAGYEAVLALDANNLVTIYNMGVLYQEYYQDYETALEWFRRFASTRGAAQSELYSDVSTRIELLAELIELLRDQPPAPREPEAPPVEDDGAAEPTDGEEGTAAPID